MGDSKARLGAFSVIPGHPERRIAEWYVCPDHACYHRTYALAVSDDGFRTLHVVDLAPSRVANGWYLEPAGRDHFAISPNGGRRSLVDLSGRVTRIAITGPAGPMVGSEVPLRSSKAGFVAVDPDTGHAHPLATPAGVVELQTSPSGQLRGLTMDSRYYWSDDGGSAWHEIPLPPDDEHLTAEFVPTPSDGLHVLVLGGENTVFSWDRVLKSTDGATWTSSYDGPNDPTGYLGETVILPDGRLLVNVDGWSDATNKRPSAHQVGLYAGADWAHLRPVPVGPPFAGQDRHTFAPTILDLAVTAQSVTIYAETPDQKGVVSSTDGGTTWRPEGAR